MRLRISAFICVMAASDIALAQVTTIGDANALSPPAARHLVRIDPGGGFPATYLLAIQREDIDRQQLISPQHPGLSFYRSTDDGATWSFYATINASNYATTNAGSERDTVDLVKVGNDVAIVYSYDGPSLLPSSTLDPMHKVVFQWWRYNGAGGWTGQPPVTVFSPATGTAYHRAELAIDSAGRIWVQAWLRASTPCTSAACTLCLTNNGDNYPNTLVVAVSTNGGTSFQQQPSLASTVCRAGGRLSSVGTKLIMLWNDYSYNQNGTVVVTRFMTRNDTDLLSSWAPASNAFPDDPADGIYHGAALSSVADGAGGLHLVYKDQNLEKLYYRYFNGTSFGLRQLIDPSHDDWALQPATTLINGDLYVFANHLVNSEQTPWPAGIDPNNYQVRFWKKSAGWGVFKLTDSQVAFKAYPTAPETVPSTALRVPAIFGQTLNADSSGNARITYSPDFSLSDNPNSVTVSAAASGTSTITVNVTNGFDANVTLSSTGVPAGATLSFSPNPVAPGGSSTATFNSGTASPGTYACTVSGTGYNLTRTVGLACAIRDACAPLTSCGGQCVDTSTSHSNCGGCGNICPAAQSCVAGACSCPAGTLTCCGGDICWNGTQCPVCP